MKLRDIVILFACLLVLIISISKMNDAYADKLKNTYLNTLVYKEHIIQQGDTLWGIVKEWHPGEDPREVVYIIREINEIEDPQKLEIGQAIWVPVEIRK